MNKLNARQVSEILGVTSTTLSRWYKWYRNCNVKPEGCPELPLYEQVSPTSPRLWNESDINALKKFQHWIPKGNRGVMGEVSHIYWGKKQRPKKYNKV